MTRTFVMTKTFDKQWEKLSLSDEDLYDLQVTLANDPSAGDMIQGTHGCRKFRIPLKNTGKSGGARVIYVDFIKFEKIYLITVYSKNESDDLTKQEYNNIKNIVKDIESAERALYERRMKYECI